MFRIFCIFSIHDYAYKYSNIHDVPFRVCRVCGKTQQLFPIGHVPSGYQTVDKDKFKND